jgi:hypothetical protein
MGLARRQFLRLAAGVAALPAISRIAWAQIYPSRPVHWILPYQPGGPSDTTARLLAQSLSERLGIPFLIENRPELANVRQMLVMSLRDERCKGNSRKGII